MRGRMPRWVIGTLALVLATAACGDDDSTVATGVLARASDQTNEVESLRMAMSVRLTGLPGQADVDAQVAEGVFALSPERGRLTLDFDELLGAAGLGAAGAQVPSIPPLELVVDGSDAWLRLPNRTPPYARLGGGLLEQFAGPNVGVDPGDPSTALDLLRSASDDVQELGATDVRGTPTTGYRALVSVDDLLEKIPEESRADARAALEQADLESFPIEVYVDAGDLVRRIVLTFDLAGLAGAAGAGRAEGGSMAIQVDFFDFGTPVDVAVPTPDQVSDEVVDDMGDFQRVLLQSLR